MNVNFQRITLCQNCTMFRENMQSYLLRTDSSCLRIYLSDSRDHLKGQNVDRNWSRAVRIKEKDGSIKDAFRGWNVWWLHCYLQVGNGLVGAMRGYKSFEHNDPKAKIFQNMCCCLSFFSFFFNEKKVKLEPTHICFPELRRLIELFFDGGKILSVKHVTPCAGLTFNWLY